MTQNGGALSLTGLSSTPEKLLPHRPEVLGEDSGFAVQTRPRHEKRVSLGLQEKGVPTFLPLYREKRQWTDRQQWVELPLFSHYVFCAYTRDSGIASQSPANEWSLAVRWSSRERNASSERAN